MSTPDPWHGLGVDRPDGTWQRPCIFACQAPCADGCAPMTTHGRGPTLLQASRVDQRFAYCLYVPLGYREHDDRRYPLLVVVHGTERDPIRYRNDFAAFAEEQQCIVLAPLFPCGIIEPAYEMHNYKFLAFHDIRYDEVQLRMIDEVGAMYRLDADRFLLFGFSGGGQFVHRFAYVHPERLMAVSIGAPGWVTLLDPDQPWWVGTGGMEAVFGHPVDLGALRQVAVQMVVGQEDVDPWDVVLPEGSRYWMPGMNDAGPTRVARIEALRDSFERNGISVTVSTVPGVAHMGHDVLAPVQAFFATVLASRSPLIASHQEDTA